MDASILKFIILIIPRKIRNHSKQTSNGYNWSSKLYLEMSLKCLIHEIYKNVCVIYMNNYPKAADAIKQGNPVIYFLFF